MCMSHRAGGAAHFRAAACHCGFYLYRIPVSKGEKYNHSKTEWAIAELFWSMLGQGDGRPVEFTI